MKKLSTILCTVMMVTATACQHEDIWKELREHEQRIELLEKQCKELNANLEAIQVVLTALQQNDYVTNIIKIMEGGIEIGYSFTFSKGGTVTIYHGSDGSTPQIGIKKASDGGYYWTSNGEWMTDDSGNMIPATVTDPDGNYVTPQFRVSEGVWYVSYDNGNSWRVIELENSDDDIIFKDVTYNEYYVFFELADGTTITIPTKDLIDEQKSRTSEVRLAKRYDLVVGDTFQLFYTGTVKAFNIENEGVRVVCSVGSQMPRYFEYTPTEEDAGKSYKLTITTRRFDGSVISEGETMLHVHPKLTNMTTPSHLNMLIFGDSLTSGGRWPGEGLRRIYGTDMSVKPQSLGVTNTCTTYGTKNALINGYSVYHEGYGGWTWDRFLKLDAENPFYNPDNGSVDFKYHAAKYNNRGADVIAVLLTGNGAGVAKDFNHQARIDKHMASAATMLRKIHSDFPNAKIICLGQLVCNNKGGMGTNYGATGTYSDPYATLFYLFDFSKSLEQLVTNEEFSEYCYYVDNKAQFDVDYNLPYKNEPVNSRNDSVTEVEGTNGLHPTNAGYHQIGDAFYRALHRVLPTIGGNEDLGNSEGEW